MTKVPLPQQLIGMICAAVLLASCSSNFSNSGPSYSVDNLTAQQLLEMGIRYQKMGRVELSRDSLTKAQEKDPHGKIGERSLEWLRAKVPPHKISQEAEQRNVIGVNQRLHGDNQAARETLTKVIHDYPDFEWPYGNLALVCLSENKPEEAEAILKNALRINPNYANGWQYLGRTKQMLGDQKTANECFAKSSELFSDTH